MRNLTLVIIAFIGLNLNAQSSAKFIQNAKGEIARDDFKKALVILEPVIEKDPQNKEALKLAGYCYLNIAGKEEKAVSYLEKAVSLYPANKTSFDALETRFYLAQALHQSHKFGDALAIYERLLNETNAKKLKKAINREIRYCRNAIELVKKPRDFKVFNLGEAINSPYDEHSPLVAFDEPTIYFTSNRPLKGMEKDEGSYYENIYVSYWRDGEWTNAQIIEMPGSYFGNRATVSLSSDGNTMILYQNDGYKGSLFTSQLDFKRGVAPVYGFKRWSEPVPLSINSTNFNETHACFSPDGTQIWFTSDRPGGYGGRDIYVSHKMPDGTWGPSMNAGPNINTELDEESPFLSPDGSILYFSSEGHNSIGGFDIFQSKKSVHDDSWLPAENIGYPINTANDDIFFLPTPDGQRFYYSSRKLGGVGESDLYVIVFPDEDIRSQAVLASYILEPDETPVPDPIIRIVDENGKSHGFYRPNSINGKFVAILPTGFKYFLEIEAENYETVTHEVSLPLRDVYGTRQRAVFIPNIIMKKIE